MANYMMIYRGEATDTSDMSEEDAAAVMAKWGVWMESVGPALTSVGAPFGPGTSLVDDGTTRSALSLTGYSVVEADSAETARALADGHPYLSDGNGEFSIELFELMPVPFEE